VSTVRVLGDRGGVGAIGGLRGEREEVVEVSREVPLETAQGSLLGLAFGAFAVQERPGLGVDTGAGDRDDVQRPVELAVASPV
jgi:hypothetical protein